MPPLLELPVHTVWFTVAVLGTTLNIYSVPGIALANGMYISTRLDSGEKKQMDNKKINKKIKKY